MTKQIVKSILIGVLAGVALFILPFFLLRVLLFFLIIGALYRLLKGRGFRRWQGYRFGGFHPAFADTIRNMSEEEYTVFQQKFQTPCYPVSQTKKPEQNSASSTL